VRLVRTTVRAAVAAQRALRRRARLATGSGSSGASRSPPRGNATSRSPRAAGGARDGV